MYLVDTNGPFLGGVGKACRIVVQIHDQDSIVVEDCDESVDGVIDRITDRLGVVVSKYYQYARLSSKTTCKIKCNLGQSSLAKV